MLILYIYSAASNQLGDFSLIDQISTIIYIFNCACFAALMLIFAVNQSVNRSKKIGITAIIFIISYMAYYLLMTPSLYKILFSYWFSYIPIALFVSLLILAIHVLKQRIADDRKTSNALFIILLCSATGSIIFLLVLSGQLTGLNSIFLTFVLLVAYKDKGFYKYYIETHPKYLIKGRRYFY